MSQRRLTVLQVLPALEAGGTERSVLDIAEGLVSAGHRSLVVSAGGQLVKTLTDAGSEHIQRGLGVKSPLTLRHVAWLRRFLLDQKVDVIDIQSRMPGWIAWLAWKSLPVTQRPALISTLNGLHSTGLYSSIMCRGQHVIAVSSAVRDYVRRHYPFVAEDRLHVIYRGIDSSQFPRGLQPDSKWATDFYSRFPAMAGKPILTLAGRITRLKGHADFLKLLLKLRERGVSAHGLIVGGADPGKASYAAEIKAQAEELQLTGNVSLAGHCSDMKQIYSMSSIVLSLSSKPESFGLTVAEALSIGTPVVGYSHGGVAEILAAQFPMGAVEPGDIDELADRVVAILTQEPRPVPAPCAFEKRLMQKRTLEIYQAAVRGD